jgi:hypothetical protein
MTTQLSLFACEPSELESKALLVVELDQEILDLMEERRGKGAELREEIKDLTAQIKEAKDRRAQASKELYGLKRAGV